MRIPLSIALAMLTVLTLVTGVPATPKLQSSISVHSQVISPGWTTITLSCNGAIINATTFIENLAGRDTGSTFFRVDSIAPSAFFLYENLSYASIDQIWCLHGFALVNAAIAFSYSGSLTNRILSSGNYTLVAQPLFTPSAPFSSSVRLSESWAVTTIA